MRSNPFRFGTPLGGRPLIGRDGARAELVRAISEGRDFALVAPRGQGKTALALAALAEWKRKGGRSIYVDFFPAINPRRFAEIYASALTLEPSQSVQDMQEAVQQLVPSFMPRVTITGSGRPGLQLDLWDRERDMKALLARILEAPEHLAAETDKPLALVYDGFEDLLDSLEADLLRDFAQSVRRHRNVAHLFVLRKESTAKRVFQDEHNPFYRLAEAVVLDPVDDKAMVAGLRALFDETGVPVEEPLLAQLVTMAERNPYGIQALAHSFWEAVHSAQKASEAELQSALEDVLEAHVYGYRAMWDPLSLHQRNLVLAIAQGFTERLHSQRMVFDLGLGSPSTVSKNLKTLIDREILQRQGQVASFVDPFFGHWIRRTMT